MAWPQIDVQIACQQLTAKLLPFGDRDDSENYPSLN